MTASNATGRAIFVGVGANLPGPAGPPRATCGAALAMLDRSGVKVARCSPWYRTAPVPVSDQPWYVNAVAQVETDLGPEDLLARLLAVEEAFGRRRSEPNAPRTLDLDLVDYAGRVSAGNPPPVLPHPRLETRAFVILPLADLAPGWRHPISGVAVADLIRALPKDQSAERMAPGSGPYRSDWDGVSGPAGRPRATP